MEPTQEEPKPVSAAANGNSDAGSPWTWAYAGVLAHLVLWIGLLWLFSRSFGSAQ